MTFVYAAALAVAILAVAPFVAHLLQRRRADERDFPPARLVPPSQPVARRRRRIDDRALYAVRTVAVLALALLGATPFARCSSLALGREGGASIALAIVLDDSLSMLAEVEQKTRWDRALRAADELVEGAREGDAVGVVLAGAPPRIALAATTDLAAARSVVRSLSASHRATDLEGALELAQSLVHGLPQTDRRMVLLSDLADGHPDGPPLGESSETPLWVPLTDLAQPAANCAVLRADRQRDRATIRVACFPAAESRRRSIEIYAGDKVVGRTPLPDEAGGVDVGVDLAGASGDLEARITGKDAIRADDVAPVLATTGGLSIAIIADPAGAKLVTGGAPPVEQALAALELDVRLRPLPLLPDRLEDLAGFAGMVIEDPPGFTPEARRSLAAWTDRGGVVLLALGPHAPLAPLGANFEPLVPGSITWGPSPSPGLDDKASVLFGSAAAGLVDFRPRGRATVDLNALGGAVQVSARWKDGAPWLIERPLGRGFVFILTVPTSPDESDLALRPAFLLLLDRLVDATRTRNGAYRITVGEAWSFEGAKSLEVVGPEKAQLRVTEEGTRKVVVPDRIGAYDITLDRDKLTRIVAASEKEVDGRPRKVSPGSQSSSLGDTRARVDLSPYLAIGLLALLVSELALRLRARRTPPLDAERASPAS
ncbi:MAG TPA: VWA domain-containing protein [Polyangiaceae bacterium]|nr:VWA domain-containing protein [Polyangiaceae bacterium]